MEAKELSDEIRVTPVESVPRNWALFIYGLFCLVGLAGDWLYIHNRGVSRPIELVIPGALFGGSVAWLIGAWRENFVSKRDLSSNLRVGMLLVVLLSVAVFLR
jgi:hypothetical protein